MTISRLVASTLVALLVAACTPARPPPVSTAAMGAAEAAPPAAKVSCEEHKRAATAIVAAAIDKARACAADADCVAVSFGASCFDSCTRAIGASGKAAYDQAVAEANDKECAAFFKDGCKLPLPPPCAPQRPASCRDGLCT